MNVQILFWCVDLESSGICLRAGSQGILSLSILRNYKQVSKVVTWVLHSD